MKKKFLGVMVLLPFMACNNDRHVKIEYPHAKKVDTVDVYFGNKVPDPYRWLEDDNSQETAEWVKAENKVTFDYLGKIPFREKIRSRLKEI